jgi:hypothetical protein
MTRGAGLCGDGGAREKSENECEPAHVTSISVLDIS